MRAMGNIITRSIYAALRTTALVLWQAALVATPTTQVRNHFLQKMSLSAPFLYSADQSRAPRHSQWLSSKSRIL